MDVFTDHAMRPDQLVIADTNLPIAFVRRERPNEALVAIIPKDGISQVVTYSPVVRPCTG